MLQAVSSRSSGLFQGCDPREDSFILAATPPPRGVCLGHCTFLPYMGLRTRLHSLHTHIHTHTADTQAHSSRLVPRCLRVRAQVSLPAMAPHSPSRAVLCGCLEALDVRHSLLLLIRPLLLLAATPRSRSGYSTVTEDAGTQQSHQGPLFLHTRTRSPATAGRGSPPERHI